MIVNRTWWLWVLLVAGFIFLAIRASADRCLPAFYMAWMRHYNVEYAEVSTVLGAFYIGQVIAGLTGPAAMKRWSLRKWMLLCGVISTLSTATAFLKVPFWFVAVLFGGIPGYCFGFQIIVFLKALSVVIPEERRIGAFQFLYFGCAVGPFLACPAWQLLINNYTWSGAVLIISSVYFQTVLIGVLLVGPESEKAKEITAVGSSKDEQEDVPHCCGSKFLRSLYISLDVGLFRLPQTYIILLFYGGFACGLFVTTSYIIPFGVQGVGLTELQASFLPSAMAVGEVCAKLVVALLFPKLPESCRKFFVGAGFVLAAMLLFVLPSVHTYIPALVICAVFGLLEGATDGILVNYFVELIPGKYFAAINSYCNVIGYSLLCAVNMLAGYVVDTTGQLGNAFYIAGSMFVLSSSGMLLLHFQHRKVEQRAVKSQQGVVE